MDRGHRRPQSERPLRAHRCRNQDRLRHPDSRPPRPRAVALYPSLFGLTSALQLRTLHSVAGGRMTVAGGRDIRIRHWGRGGLLLVALALATGGSAAQEVRDAPGEVNPLLADKPAAVRPAPPKPKP